MNENKNQNKVVVLCEDKEQRTQNVRAFARNFKKDHKALVDRLAA